MNLCGNVAAFLVGNGSVQGSSVWDPVMTLLMSLSQSPFPSVSRETQTEELETHCVCSSIAFIRDHQSSWLPIGMALWVPH